MGFIPYVVVDLLYLWEEEVSSGSSHTAVLNPLFCLFNTYEIKRIVQLTLHIPQPASSIILPFLFCLYIPSHSIAPLIFSNRIYVNWNRYILIDKRIQPCTLHSYLILEHSHHLQKFSESLQNNSPTPNLANHQSQDFHGKIFLNFIKMETWSIYSLCADCFAQNNVCDIYSWLQVSVVHSLLLLGSMPQFLYRFK